MSIAMMAMTTSNSTNVKPVHFTDRLIDTIANSKKVIPYLDMPLQHINDTMLKRMQRRVNRSQTEELVNKLRERVDNLVLRTTFITGFPGETDAQFAELRDFIAKTRFERMGVFTNKHFLPQMNQCCYHQPHGWVRTSARS